MEDMGIEELREQYKREKDADVRERILMIIWLKSGKSTYEIGNLLFCPHSKVAYWKKRFNSGGLEGLRTAERPGRPGSIDGRTEEEIRTELSGSDHWNTSEISRIVQEKSGVTYTRRHIRRMAQEWGYSLITLRKKHRDSASPEDVEKFKKKQERYWSLSGKE